MEHGWYLTHIFIQIYASFYDYMHDARFMCKCLFLHLFYHAFLETEGVDGYVLSEFVL
jgi:hypothetical protein